MCQDRRQVLSRESLATQKQRDATTGKLELADATSRTDAVDRDLPIRQDKLVNLKGIRVGEQRQEVYRLSHDLDTQLAVFADMSHKTYVRHGG